MRSRKAWNAAVRCIGVQVEIAVAFSQVEPEGSLRGFSWTSAGLLYSRLLCDP